MREFDVQTGSQFKDFTNKRDRHGTKEYIYLKRPGQEGYQAWTVIQT